MRGLRAIRTAERDRYTVNEVAKSLGVSARTYRKYEREPDKLTMEKARQLADYLGCSVDEVFYLPNEGN